MNSISMLKLFSIFILDGFVVHIVQFSDDLLLRLVYQSKDIVWIAQTSKNAHKTIYVFFFTSMLM